MSADQPSSFSSSSAPNPATFANSNPAATIFVLTSDGVTLEVKTHLMAQSGVFRQMYMDLGMSSMDDCNFPVDISEEVMRKVIVWMETHNGEPEPTVTEDPLTHERRWFDLSESDRQFLDVPPEELFRLLRAANFLDLKSLYLYTCQTIADRIKDRPPEEVRRFFGFDDDLTDDEKEKIMRDNVWCTR